MDGNKSLAQNLGIEKILLSILILLLLIRLNYHYSLITKLEKKEKQQDSIIRTLKAEMKTFKIQK